MYPDEQYRSFLLGMADAETEADVDDGLLDGRIDPGHLQQVEEELIDDHLFGRLSSEEESAFRSQFLATAERGQKLEFARALKRYASRYPQVVKRPGLSLKLRKWLAVPWMLPLVGSLSCALLAVLWLGERNSSLNDQLAQATSASDEHQRVIESMLKEQRERAIQPAALTQSTEKQATPQPVVRLSPGVTRELAVLPLLHIDQHESTADIVLELPFTPKSTLHEELQDSAGQTIWKQEFAVTSGLAEHGTTSIMLPTGLLASGEYQLRAGNGSQGGEHGDEATYLFRVRKD